MWRRFYDYLILIIMLEAIRIFAVSAVGRAAARLDISHLPRLRPQNAQESGRVHSARADFNVVWLLDHATAVAPEFLQAHDEFLKIHHISLRNSRLKNNETEKGDLQRQRDFSRFICRRDIPVPHKKPDKIATAIKNVGPTMPAYPAWPPPVDEAVPPRPDAFHFPRENRGKTITLKKYLSTVIN